MFGVNHCSWKSCCFLAGGGDLSDGTLYWSSAFCNFDSRHNERTAAPHPCSLSLAGCFTVRLKRPTWPPESLKPDRRREGNALLRNSLTCVSSFFLSFFSPETVFKFKALKKPAQLGVINSLEKVCASSPRSSREWRSAQPSVSFLYSLEVF